MQPESLSTLEVTRKMMLGERVPADSAVTHFLLAHSLELRQTNPVVFHVVPSSQVFVFGSTLPLLSFLETK